MGRGRSRTERVPWELLWHRNFRALPSWAGSSTPGALTADKLGDVATIINPSSNYLHATAGVSVVNGSGLKLDSTGAALGANDNHFSNQGAGVYWLLTDLLPASKWPNTNPGPEKLWSELVVEAIVNVSGINANGEGIAVGTANASTFGLGTGSATHRVSGAINCTAVQHGSAYVTVTSTQALVGIPAAPNVMVVSTTPQGGGIYWKTGASAGVVPRKPYTRDQYVAQMVVNAGNTVGGYIRAGQVIYVGIIDTGKTALIAYLEDIWVWGRQRDYRFPTSPGSLTAVAA